MSIVIIQWVHVEKGCDSFAALFFPTPTVHAFGGTWVKKFKESSQFLQTCTRVSWSVFLFPFMVTIDKIMQKNA